jgi:hypothetical protein
MIGPRCIALAAALTRAWVAAYTLGVVHPLRDERRAELASDIWEQAHATPAPGAVHALSLLWRCLRGVPADLSWRIEHRAGTGPALGGAMSRAGARTRRAATRGASLLALLAAGGSLLLGLLVLVTLGTGREEPVAGLVVFATVCIGAGLLVLWGRRAAASHTVAGPLATAAGTLPLGLFAWQTVIIPLLAAAVLLHSLSRAWLAWRTRRRPGWQPHRW